MSKPFACTTAMMAAIAAAISAGMSHSFVAANIGQYHSRGHGRGKYSGRGHGNPGTDWQRNLNGQTNGRRECERRMRQMAKAAA